jgi:hypothetical protein
MASSWGVPIETPNRDFRVKGPVDFDDLTVTED